MSRYLYIDIETKNRDGLNLTKVGLYKYAEKVQIDLFSYAYDNGPVKTVDLANGERVPRQVLEDMVDDEIIKSAANAIFEMVCCESFFEIALIYKQWRCTLVRAGMCGLPMDLDNLTRVLQVENMKDSNGKALIRYWSMPCKATKVNGGRTWNLSKHNPAKWEQYKRYNAIDVLAERDSSKKLQFYEIPNEETNYWILDCMIARRGVYVDKPFIENAILMDQVYRNRLLKEAMRITGLSNANSVAQLKEWLSVEMDEEIESLRKTDLPDMLERAESKSAKRIITIRQDLAKTSVKKYHTMINAMCSDGRLRGLIQYYGASRTGRAAGRLVQVHNLPRGNFKKGEKMETARRMVEIGSVNLLEMGYGAIPDTLSSLIRSSFIPSPGKRMLIADFRQIEARVLAWLAGDKKRLKIFERGEDIYLPAAAAIFGVAPEDVDDELRQRGKVFELACGFGGGKFAVIAMDTKKLLKEGEIQPLVDKWRESNPNITEYWKVVEKAAKHAIQYGGRCTITHGITFEFKKGFLFITLPSGRKLSYANATLKPGKEWGTRIVYWGMHQTKKKWWEMETYGGKLVENIVQAIARDCLYFGLMNAHKAGYDIVMHVHDEVVAETKKGSIEELNRIFSIVPPWAKGLPLESAGFESRHYKK